MRETATILLILFSMTVFAKEQANDILIYHADTFYINSYPLETLMQSDSLIHDKISNYRDTMCISSDCWRGHIGTWLIENDSLFLIELQTGCDSLFFILRWVFGDQKVKKGRVFADWYSANIEAGFGDNLGFDEENWQTTYSHRFNCNIRSGIIKKLTISQIKNPQSEDTIIDSIENTISLDTTAFLFVDETPALISENKIYELFDLKEFIMKNMLYPDDAQDCIGSVFISFIVEKDGSISNKEFVRKLCSGFDENAMKVIDLMVKWRPGVKDGKIVRTKIVLPLRFRYD